MTLPEYVQASLFEAAEDILAYSTNVSPLHKRAIMHLEKRRDQCSATTYCPDGYYCISSYTCRKNANYAWTAIFGVLALLCIILFCIRRRRASRAMTTQQEVVVTTNQDVSQYQPQQTFAPPPGDPNLAYQTPAMYPPPGSSPYPGAPASPPAAYPPPGSAAYPPPAYPPAGHVDGASPYMVPYSSPAPAPGPGPYPASPAPVPYPVHQGEAASYNPPAPGR
ncbi:hypothetical protein B0O80DRAFT_452537 [Mortierella sp. GBAus27b]|nr:hypothetical protein BGX31_010583 [Mortierella sp. GBA43]KAI8353577.1 hypothetical protein B0O80DRAFT_452537 [Mortierella sp. GBAus27b]